MRQTRPELPCILVSGCVCDELRALATTQGVHHVLNKTSALDELVQLPVNASDTASARAPQI